MARSLSTLTAGLLLGTTFTLTPVAAKEPWYQLIWNVEHTAQQCLPTDPRSGPDERLRRAELKGWTVRMHDVEDNGEVVQTSMHGLVDIDGRPLDFTWYRGLARCEAAKRAEQQRAREKEQLLQRKYR